MRASFPQKVAQQEAKLDREREARGEYGLTSYARFHAEEIAETIGQKQAREYLVAYYANK